MAKVKAMFPAILMSACVVVPLRAAVVFGQIEDFSGSHGWTSGDPNPNPPVTVPDSGPLGGGDSALRVTSNGGSGPGGKLVVFNRTLWTGNYPAAGVSTIMADLRNSGSTSLSFRLAFNGPGGWFVTAGSPVTAFSGWNSKEFDIRPAALLPVGGSSAAATLAAVSEMRILHSAAVGFTGAQVSGAFLVDNLRAVPEPSAFWMIGLAGLRLLFRKR
ncbi:MAG: hypothetical protein RLZZ214_697 [Verrucomicrobiota bacterium]|jgi:hypothetical protein